MNKGLEALKRVKTSFNSNCLWAQESCNIIEKELKALEVISKAYGDYANHKISEYELIMTVGENATH